jgi:hypothetical protein
MKTFNTKLIVSAMGIALLASPAFARMPAHQMSQTEQQYTNGNQNTGSASNTFDRDHGYYAGGRNS